MDAYTDWVRKHDEEVQHLGAERVKKTSKEFGTFDRYVDWVATYEANDMLHLVHARRWQRQGDGEVAQRIRDARDALNALQKAMSEAVWS